VFEIDMLPAREGDCLWIRYGQPNKSRHILVDGGRAATAQALRERFDEVLAPNEKFELLIVTHIDRDHIEGVMELLEDPATARRFKDVWFNGYDHLKDVKLETFGALQGERVSAALLANKQLWNRQWKKKAVCLAKTGLKRVELAGGMALTLFSPDRAKLAKLVPVWEKECKAAGVVPGVKAKKGPKGLESFGGIDIEVLAVSKFAEDSGEPNGSSIAVLAEYGGTRALLTGDAHSDRLVASIKAFKKTAKRLKLDAFKVAHHGSEHNTSRELIELLDCKRYLISTNGSQFKHPRREAMARIIKFGGNGATIYFNYKTAFTKDWSAPAWRARYGYDVVYPDSKTNGSLTVAL
jgi:beta-lactamase superfamily II metal-dependent hydrolase